MPRAEVHTFFGGRGFSTVAIVYDLAGWTLALVADLIVPPHIRPSKKKEEEEDVNEKFDYEE